MATNRPNPVFVKQGADVLADLDERDVVIVGSDTKRTILNSLGGYGSYTSGSTSGAVTTFDGGDFGALNILIPQLGDISIVSQSINYTTMPPTVDVVIKIKNSTKQIVKGIAARLTN